MLELTIADSLAILESARAAAIATGASISIAIVDAGGNLLAFLRMDDALLASIEVSQVKARTALYFGTETAHLPGALPITPALLAAVSYPLAFIPGGVPIRREGKLLGAIGVGGGTAEQDHSIALSAARQ